jgi:hypothetical protein
MCFVRKIISGVAAIAFFIGSMFLMLIGFSGDTYKWVVDGHNWDPERLNPTYISQNLFACSMGLIFIKLSLLSTVFGKYQFAQRTAITLLKDAVTVLYLLAIAILMMKIIHLTVLSWLMHSNS